MGDVAIRVLSRGEKPDLPRFFRRSFDVWREAASLRGEALASDLHPKDYSEVLENAILARVHHHPLDIEFRIVGQLVLDNLGSRVVGQRLSHLAKPEEKPRLWGAYARAVETRNPVFLKLDYVGPSQFIASTEELYLPFCDAGRRVTSMLVIVDLISNVRMAGSASAA